MAKDDDLLAASGRPPPRRALASPGRKTAPAGTPMNKLPADVAPVAVTTTSSRPPSGAQNTMTPPRTVGGHTARLYRGDDVDDSDLEAPDVVDVPRPRVQDRARARAAAVAAAAAIDDDDEETVARIAAKVKQPPAGARGGTMRMDASDRPPALGPHAVAAARRNPPPAPGPPPRLPVFDLDGVDDDVPSTARGGTGRDLPELAPAARPAPAPAALGPLVVPQLAPVPAPVAAPVFAPAPAPAPVIAAAPPPPIAAPTDEISISGSEFEATGLPPQDAESRWPFAFAVGAVSLAIGSLLPLPFRQYIVRDRGPMTSMSASASVAVSASAPVVVAPEAHPTAAAPHTATPVLPSALAAVPSIAPTAPTSATRPPAFGTVKIPRPNPSTPKDVF
jgi:hypothetical protein